MCIKGHYQESKRQHTKWEKYLQIYIFDKNLVSKNIYKKTLLKRNNKKKIQRQLILKMGKRFEYTSLQISSANDHLKHEKMLNIIIPRKVKSKSNEIPLHTN